ncbi:biotin--[acetyl-CoA-carboxylase] ligase [Actinospica sp.]|jgi:BirA family biotin operon repressor/biotin-[acetyl-CoA-carboxylase] ligase|uniref:biotin--[acetyl-CoA-carboxylase] ligase n=1 Tax=Actinospica sp. TaxID=1872142 RepID=UPI002B984418|nr:biotin--[acetyl-CoA-carboxylase] ligase [Actinospica sp.]HWG26413.1 biotin--[acetyl-CoA-carboxylase] ligase [Actinospica sp.]
MVSAYNDLDRPPLDERSLQRALMTPGGFVSAVRVLPSVESTNTALIGAAQDGAPHASVVVAEEQTAGKGRLGRTWTAPARSGLFVSILVRPELPPAAWTWLPLLAGISARDAVARACRLEIGLKWPNDLVVAAGELADRKLGGILCETVPGEAAVVVGIGVNVSLRQHELPVPQACSLALAGAESTDRDPLLRALLRSFGDWYTRWSEAGGDADAAGLREAYLRACVTLGREVRAELPGERTVTGRASGVDRAGALLVTTADQRETAIGAGDVVHLRPAAGN